MAAVIVWRNVLKRGKVIQEVGSNVRKKGGLTSQAKQNKATDRLIDCTHTYTDESRGGSEEGGGDGELHFDYYLI